jgi:hypothetical protein
MMVWIVQEECPDYYCGCGGGHLVGIYTTAQEAHDVAVELGIPEYNRPDAITPVEIGVTRRYSYGPNANGDWVKGSWT